MYGKRIVVLSVTTSGSRSFPLFRCFPRNFLPKKGFFVSLALLPIVFLSNGAYGCREREKIDESSLKLTSLISCVQFYIVSLCDKSHIHWCTVFASISSQTCMPIRTCKSSRIWGATVCCRIHPLSEVARILSRSVCDLYWLGRHISLRWSETKQAKYVQYVQVRYSWTLRSLEERNGSDIKESFRHTGTQTFPPETTNTQCGFEHLCTHLHEKRKAISHILKKRSIFYCHDIFVN